MCDTWLENPSSQDSRTLIIFLRNAFWPSYEQKRDSKNVENPPKSPIYGQKSGPI